MAPDTARYLLAAAIMDVDEAFGAGFAKAHPLLVGFWMLVASQDLGHSTIAQAIAANTGQTTRRRR